MTPLAVDLFCGLGGWTEGLLAEGYRVVGYDTQRHVYGSHQYPAQLVLQDVLTLHGSQFKDAALIVASPPCQAYSYRAMPWKRAKALPLPDNTLFEACFRIQLEAIEAAGHFIPLVVENVCGAQKWVGKARWHYGSFYLWGDVPALMPIVNGRRMKWPAYGDTYKKTGRTSQWNAAAEKEWRAAHNTTSGHGQNPDGRKTVGHLNIRDGHSHARHLTNQAEHGTKVSGDWFGSYADMKAAGTISPGRLHGKSSTARQAASAQIAKIPLPLARWIARAWYPTDIEASA